MATVEKLFGIHFPLKLEPVIYGITERMAKDYSGGYWDFHTLSNGGFYMAMVSSSTCSSTGKRESPTPPSRRSGTGCAMRPIWGTSAYTT